MSGLNPCIVCPKRDSGLSWSCTARMIRSCTCESYFGIQYKKLNLDLVPGFGIVLVLRILILEKGEGVPELMGFVF